LPSSISSAGVNRGSRPIVARYQVIGSLLLRRLLSLTLVGDEVIGSPIEGVDYRGKFVSMRVFSATL